MIRRDAVVHEVEGASHLGQWIEAMVAVPEPGIVTVVECRETLLQGGDDIACRKLLRSGELANTDILSLLVAEEERVLVSVQDQRMEGPLVDTATLQSGKRLRRP